MRLFHIGERVRIRHHVWFARGVTHGVITSARTHTGAQTIYYVRPDFAGVRSVLKRMRIKLTSDYLFHLED